MKSNITPNTQIKNEMDTPQEKKNVKGFVLKKCNEVEELILETYHFLENTRQYDIFSNHNISQCIDLLHSLHEKVHLLIKKTNQQSQQDEKILDDLQFLYDKLLTIFTNYGSYSLKNVLHVVFGAKYDIFQLDKVKDIQKAKFEIIEKYITPIGLKHLTWSRAISTDIADKISEQIIKVEIQQQFECLLPTGSYTSLHQNVYGLRIVFRHDKNKKLITMNGLIKNVPIQFIKNNLYIQTRIKKIIEEYEYGSEINVSKEVFERWLDSLTIKELLIYSTKDLLKLLNSIQNDVNYVKQNSIDKIIKHFFDMDLISRRKMLIHLILYNVNNEVQYIAYMLYDLIGSADACDGSDNNEQRKLYESLSWKLKQFFKETMINTIEFTQETITKSDDHQATLEQKVLLLRANDKVRDKAMAKLKEVKGKSDDQASKSKQYLEGLVKIPFGNFRKEPILCIMEELNDTFKRIKTPDKTKEQYTLYEITKYTHDLCINTETVLNKELNLILNKKKKNDLLLIMEQFTTESYKTKAKILKVINENLVTCNKKNIVKFIRNICSISSKITIL